MRRTREPKLKQRFETLLKDDFTRSPSEDSDQRRKKRILVSKNADRLYKVISVLTTIAIIALLLFAVAHSPQFGDPNNPTMNEVSQRYVEEGVIDTGATNTVAGMILDYRAFDTFGEAIMMFTAAMAVVGLLKVNHPKEESNETN